MGVYSQVISATATNNFLGRCEPCDRPVRGASEAAGKRAYIECPDCGGTVLGERLYATISQDRCDPRCEGAVRESCECACGGENHGRAWTHPGEHIASELERERARRADIERKRQAKAQREKVERVRAFDRWAVEHADVCKFLRIDRNIEWSDFLCDMSRAIEDCRELTEGQVAGVRRCIAAAARRSAERAAEPAPVPAPLGKGMAVTGRVLATKYHENRHQHVGGTLKMTVLDDRGFKVWGTVPTSIQQVKLSDGPGDFSPIERGDRVTFTCEIVPADWQDDPSFAKFLRPTGATVEREAPTQTN